jgi:tetratricopeptide (TPR) repeat protein
MLRKLAGAGNMDKAIAENNLAVALIPQGNYREAEALLTDAVALFKNEKVAPGNLVESLDSLAIVEEKLGKLDLAEKDATDSLNYALRIAGAESKQAANAHNEIGCIKLRKTSCTLQKLNSRLR